MTKTDTLIFEMIKYFEGDAKRIQHFIKVHEFARIIGISEGLPEREQFILETASVVHDIGIKKAEELYQRCDGILQEQLGPDIAKEMLQRLDYEDDVIERVMYLIAHHHTYTNIIEMDYQILVEADFLVNNYEDRLPREAVLSTYTKIFKTATGQKICKEMFGLL